MTRFSFLKRARHLAPVKNSQAHQDTETDPSLRTWTQAAAAERPHRARDELADSSPCCWRARTSREAGGTGQ